MGFERRRLKCEKLTDAKWWQKLTLPLARWAKKVKIWNYPFYFPKKFINKTHQKQTCNKGSSYKIQKAPFLAPRSLLFRTSGTTTWYKYQLLFCSINCGGKNSEGHDQLKQNVLHWNHCLHTYHGGWWWWWSYGTRIYNYLCNQCLSPLKLWVPITFMARCTRYNIMW